MIGRDELIGWLKTLPDDAAVGVDEGGLCLRVFDDPTVYYEIGGIPGEAPGTCMHCGDSGIAGEECDNCEPQDGLGPMVYQAVPNA